MPGVRRLEHISGRLVSYADILSAQKYEIQLLLHEAFQQPGWRKENAEGAMGMDWRYKFRWWTTSKRAIMANAETRLNRMIYEARKPYAVSPPKDIDFNNYFHTWVEDYVCTRGEWEFVRALDGMLAVSLALHAWRLERGDYPQSLRELTPEYLKKLPDDPFAVKGTFKYQRLKNDYLLYSPGPDCKDNRGKPFDNGSGDIVAGVTVSFQ